MKYVEKILVFFLLSMMLITSCKKVEVDNKSQQNIQVPTNSNQNNLPPLIIQGTVSAIFSTLLATAYAKEVEDKFDCLKCMTGECVELVAFSLDGKEEILCTANLVIAGTQRQYVFTLKNHEALHGKTYVIRTAIANKDGAIELRRALLKIDKNMSDKHFGVTKGATLEAMFTEAALKKDRGVVSEEKIAEKRTQFTADMIYKKFELLGLRSNLIDDMFIDDYKDELMSFVSEQVGEDQKTNGEATENFKKVILSKKDSDNDGVDDYSDCAQADKTRWISVDDLYVKAKMKETGIECGSAKIDNVCIGDTIPSNMTRVPCGDREIKKMCSSRVGYEKYFYHDEVETITRDTNAFSFGEALKCEKESYSSKCNDGSWVSQTSGDFLTWYYMTYEAGKCIQIPHQRHVSILPFKNDPSKKFSTNNIAPAQYFTLSKNNIVYIAPQLSGPKRYNLYSGSENSIKTIILKNEVGTSDVYRDIVPIMLDDEYLYYAMKYMKKSSKAINFGKTVFDVAVYKLPILSSAPLSFPPKTLLKPEHIIASEQSDPSLSYFSSLRLIEDGKTFKKYIFGGYDKVHVTAKDYRRIVAKPTLLHQEQVGSKLKLTSSTLFYTSVSNREQDLSYMKVYDDIAFYWINAPGNYGDNSTLIATPKESSIDHDVLGNCQMLTTDAVTNRCMGIRQDADESKLVAVSSSTAISDENDILGKIGNNYITRTVERGRSSFYTNNNYQMFSINAYSVENKKTINLFKYKEVNDSRFAIGVYNNESLIVCDSDGKLKEIKVDEKNSRPMMTTISTATSVCSAMSRYHNIIFDNKIYFFGHVCKEDELNCTTYNRKLFYFDFETKIATKAADFSGDRNMSDALLMFDRYEDRLFVRASVGPVLSSSSNEVMFEILKKE